MAGSGFWIELACSLVLLILSAKVHGAHLRTLRAIKGVQEPAVLVVHFSQPQRASNDPFVTQLWYQDKVRFWLMAPTLALAFALPIGLASNALPPVVNDTRVGVVLVSILLWAPALSLLINAGYAAAQQAPLAEQVAAAMQQGAATTTTTVAPAGAKPSYGSLPSHADGGGATVSSGGGGGSGGGAASEWRPRLQAAQRLGASLWSWWLASIAALAVCVGVLFAA